MSKSGAKYQDELKQVMEVQNYGVLCWALKN